MRYTDFTLTFRRLADTPVGDEAGLRALFTDSTGLDAWLQRWRSRLAAQDPAGMTASLRAVNPLFIPRNHLVEAALKSAVEEADYGPFEELLAVVSRPFEERPGLEDYAGPAPVSCAPYVTYCGT